MPSPQPKACPWCKTERASAWPESASSPNYQVRCPCGARGPSEYGDLPTWAEQNAIAAWNRVTALVNPSGGGEGER